MLRSSYCSIYIGNRSEQFGCLKQGLGGFGLHMNPTSLSMALWDNRDIHCTIRLGTRKNNWISEITRRSSLIVCGFSSVAWSRISMPAAHNVSLANARFASDS